MDVDVSNDDIGRTITIDRRNRRVDVPAPESAGSLKIDERFASTWQNRDKLASKLSNEKGHKPKIRPRRKTLPHHESQPTRDA